MKYRELTIAAVILGILQGVVLNVAFVYTALKLGFSIGGSTVAAIMGYTILRGILRRGTMVENNINQTIASGINTAGTGVVFTVPALYMLDASLRQNGEPGLEFRLLPLAVAGMAGAVLGVSVIIPLRKQMIEFDRLRFPSGVATTTIIRAGSAGIQKAILLAVGVAIAASWKFLIESGTLNTPDADLTARGFGLRGEDLHFDFGVIPEYCMPIVSVSLMNLAAGMLAGRNGLPFFLGGVVGWWFVAPLAVNSGWVSDASLPASDLIYAQMLRPLGIGVLIGGALMGLVMAFPAIKGALRSLMTAAKTAQAGETDQDELGLKAVIIGLTVGIAMFFVAAMLTPHISVGQAILCAVVGTIWLAVAALIVAQATGMTDISPMSGMALISVTLMMFLLDKNIAGAMVVGVAVCVAIGQGADMMQDLKTGFMIGARPRQQQIVQFATTWIGALIALAAIHILWTGGPNGANGFGNETLPAPQGGALMGIIEAVRANNIPIDKYSLGATIGAVLGAAPFSGLGVLIGLSMYLPFSITLGYGLGCFVQMGIQRLTTLSFCERNVVPLAAGLIVGEALTGVGMTAYRIFSG